MVFEFMSISTGLETKQTSNIQTTTKRINLQIAVLLNFLETGANIMPDPYLHNFPQSSNKQPMSPFSSTEAVIQEYESELAHYIGSRRLHQDTLL